MLNRPCENVSGDLFIRFWDNGRDAALDFTVISSLSPTYLDKSAREPGSALTLAYNRKMDKAFDSCNKAGISFIPMAVEALGGWHDAALHNLDKISRRVAKKSGIDQTTAKKRLFQRLAVCLQRLNASAILTRQPSFMPTYIDGN